MERRLHTNRVCGMKCGMNSKTNLGAVRDAIKSAGSQAALAEQAGCGQQTISDILRGRRTLTLNIAFKLSRASGIPVNKFRPDAVGAAQ